MMSMKAKVVNVQKEEEKKKEDTNISKNEEDIKQNQPKENSKNN